jgi:hypothetical protein
MSNSQASHENLKKAVVEACRREKPITQLKNFGEGWDFGRLVTLVEGLGKDNPMPKYDEILHALKNCRGGRNVGAHECYAKENEEVYTDEELSLLVRSARTYIPQINSNRKESAKIRKKLQELEGLLSLDEDSDVLIHCLGEH